MVTQAQAIRSAASAAAPPTGEAACASAPAQSNEPPDCDREVILLFRNSLCLAERCGVTEVPEALVPQSLQLLQALQSLAKSCHCAS